MANGENGADDLRDGATATRVFICYRRADSPHFVGRLYDSLKLEYGAEHIFRDLYSLLPGSIFAEEIREQLSRVDVVLAVIGPHWDVDGLQDPDDFVRLELEEALRQDVPVVPVLIDDTPMPSRSALPPELGRLTDSHAVQIRDQSFPDDVERLLRGIRPAVATRSQRATRAERAAAQADHEDAIQRAMTEEKRRLAEAIRLAEEEVAAASELRRKAEVAADLNLDEERAQLEALRTRRAAAAEQAEEAAAERARLEERPGGLVATTVEDAPSSAEPGGGETVDASVPRAGPSDRALVAALAAAALVVVLVIIVLVARRSPPDDATQVIEDLVGQDGCGRSEDGNGSTFGAEAPVRRVTCSQTGVTYYVFSTPQDLDAAFAEHENNASGDCERRRTWDVTGTWSRGRVACTSSQDENVQTVVWTYDDDLVYARLISSGSIEQARQQWLDVA